MNGEQSNYNESSQMDSGEQESTSSHSVSNSGGSLSLSHTALTTSELRTEIASNGASNVPSPSVMTNKKLNKIGTVDSAGGLNSMTPASISPASAHASSTPSNNFNH